MKFNEIFPEFAAGKPIHRKAWSAYSKIPVHRKPPWKDSCFDEC